MTTTIQPALAHNTASGVDGKFVPLIIENPENFPFQPGERAADWHEASDDEVAAYEAYWDKEGN